MHEELIEHARKVQNCLYIAMHEEVARDVSDTIGRLIQALQASEECQHTNIQRTHGYLSWRCCRCDKLFVVHNGLIEAA